MLIRQSNIQAVAATGDRLWERGLPAENDNAVVQAYRGDSFAGRRSNRRLHSASHDTDRLLRKHTRIRKQRWRSTGVEEDQRAFIEALAADAIQ